MFIYVFAHEFLPVSAIRVIEFCGLLQEVADMTAISGSGGQRSLQQRSPGSKLAKLAKMAESKLGRPNNKIQWQWGTLVETVTTAKVKKMLSKSRSDESVSSENEGEQDPLQDDNKINDERGNQTGQEMENMINVSGILRPNSGGGGGLKLDPAALAARHLTEKFRTRRPPKTSVSFDDNTTTNLLKIPDSATEPLVESNDLLQSTCSRSLESRTASPSLAVSESCEPLMMEHNRVNPRQTETQLSPSTSEPPTAIRSLGFPANGSLLASRLPNVQPINREMSGGWL